MKYKIEVYSGGKFRPVVVKLDGAHWNWTMPFYSVGDAQSGLDEALGLAPQYARHEYRIVDSDGQVRWSSKPGAAVVPKYTKHPAGERGATITMATVSLPIHLQKPLNLDRKKVVGKLQENLKKEKDKREEAEKKEADARNDFRQFVLDHEEQIVNYLRSCLVSSSTSWKGALEQAEETFKDDAFKTAESKPGRLESDLEKFVRVLEMSTEDTIEVEPSQQVYDLL